MQPRSGCVISAAVEVLGDHWPVLVLRDIILSDRRYFRELLTGSLEGNASNILADRLKRLVVAGILIRDDAARGQRVRHSITEAGIESLPIIYALGCWGLDWRTGASQLRARQELMRQQGPVFVPTPQHSTGGTVGEQYDLRQRPCGIPPAMAGAVFTLQRRSEMP